MPSNISPVVSWKRLGTAWNHTGQWLSIDGRTSGKYMFSGGLLGLDMGQADFLPRLLALMHSRGRRVVCRRPVCFVLLFVDGVMTLMALDAWYSRMAGMPRIHRSRSSLPPISMMRSWSTVSRPCLSTRLPLDACSRCLFPRRGGLR